MLRARQVHSRAQIAMCGEARGKGETREDQEDSRKETAAAGEVDHPQLRVLGVEFRAAGKKSAHSLCPRTTIVQKVPGVGSPAQANRGQVGARVMIYIVVHICECLFRRALQRQQSYDVVSPRADTRTPRSPDLSAFTEKREPPFTAEVSNDLHCRQVVCLLACLLRSIGSCVDVPPLQLQPY